MGCIALVRCVLVLRCGLAVVVWYPYAGWSTASIKRDQLDVTCFIISLFNAQHVSDVNTSILRSLRLICWVISWVVLLWFDVCWCYVVVWLGWCGIRMQAEAVHTDTTTPQPNHNVTLTHIEPEQYNPWYNSTNKSQAPEDGCINIRNMLSIKQWNSKATDIKLVSLYIQIWWNFQSWLLPYCGSLPCTVGATVTPPTRFATINIKSYETGYT